jgi:hypothetical protein
MYILIGKVWIVRLYFFFEYEESERHEKEKAATLRNLALSYTGNLTWYLTPIHISFLVCYCIFLVDLKPEWSDSSNPTGTRFDGNSRSIEVMK